MGSGSSNQQSSSGTQTVVQSVAPEMKPYLFGQEGIVPRALQLSKQPLNLPDYQVAGLSMPQQLAFNVAQSGIGGYMPALATGVGATNAGIGAMTQGLGVVPAALSAAQPYQLGSAMTGYGSTQGYNPTAAYQDYMNPYTQDVIDRAMSDIAGQGMRQAQYARSQAVNAGAFGGSRQAVAEAEIGRNVLDEQARTSSGLRASGFQQAQQQAQAAFEAQQQRQAQFAQMLGNLGTSYGQLGLQGASQLGALGQGLGALGGQMGALGELGQQLNIRDVGALMDIGNVQQAQQQAVLDATRQNLYQRTMAPYQQLGFFSDIVQGVPIGMNQTTTTTSTQPGASPISQIAGLAYGIGSLAAAGRQ